MGESSKENTGKIIVIVYWISLILFGVYSRMYEYGHMFGYFFLPLLPFLFVFGLILAAFPHQIGVLISLIGVLIRKFDNFEGRFILSILAILTGHIFKGGSGMVFGLFPEPLTGWFLQILGVIFLTYLFFQLVTESQENNSEE